MIDSLYTALASRVLFPLQERLKKHTSPALLRAMEDSQWWRADRLEALRFARLRALLEHVGTHVPYYRDLFARLGLDFR